MRTIYIESVTSPLGTVIVVANETALLRVGTPGTTASHLLSKELLSYPQKEGMPTAELTKQVSLLKEYLSGEKVIFPWLYQISGTPFQQEVWKELASIPYGSTITYKELASRIGRPLAVRAVGGACRVNPIAIMIPCHRVLGTNGSLTGYAGKGQVKTKQKLLEMERAH
jgi:O-6-methylguanine DNA methyltransferase